MPNQRRYPVGAELINNGVHFRVWAPAAKRVGVVINNNDKYIEMSAETNGYQSIFIPSLKAGDLYQFKLDDDAYFYPDPASRAQPEGPHGPSMIVDPDRFQWSDKHWKGIQQQSNVIYEMHIGTFTKEGTFIAATKELNELAKLGITVIELMPVNEFEGEFGWGYDGVDLYAPYHIYGTPDDLRLFIDKAHSLRIGVILDVVYNHAGSSGCYLQKFSPDYFSALYKSEWGETFNFDGKNSAPVREFFISNALYWIDEFHFDGFRFDATQQIFDSSEDYILAAIVRNIREIAGTRQLYITGENEPQNIQLIAPLNNSGSGFDALWNDDFHHSAIVAATGRCAAYFSDYNGEPQEFISNLKYSFLYQGQFYQWQKKQRGTPTFGIPAQAFIHYLQNHDQIANTGRGKRLHQLTNPALMRALTAVLLLGPQSPLLFQGQEFAASSPFLYFADNPKKLAQQVAKGRNEFLQQFPNLALPEMQSYLAKPDSPATFTQCKLNFSEREKNYETYQLHKDLLKLRQADNVFCGKDYSHIDGAILAGTIIVLRFFSLKKNDDRLLIVNFDSDFELSPAPEPLLAPHMRHTWKLLWSSESPHYGGHGSAAPFSLERWELPGLSAAVLVPETK
ncbi:malto-oligosyltrehalose trehalohydrolase [Cellvibrio mixtus]|uniref:malto-oligosyltrehalose trehalohydrolase n=1 Tax=Cellvibrio mixtus TaxID=39650 RepID=UPI000A981056|nr:malto-oligosyltrehalose trehalohydrolase [Cellvibrio mixtus]